MTIKLAINYSREAAALYREGEIALDFFKAPDWPHLIDEARQYTQVAVHFSLKAGNGKLHGTDWETILRLGEETGTPFVNLHIVNETRDWPDVDQEKPSKSHRQILIDMLRRDFEAVLTHFNPQQIIAENAPYQGKLSDVIRTSAEPEVISQLIEEYDTGLLLDISHAHITAQSLGMGTFEYMDSLPIQRLKEMHFTGIQTLNGRLVDHLPAAPHDFDRLKTVLERIQSTRWSTPWMLAFEYGGVGGPFAWRSERAAIAKDMPVLFRMLNAQASQGVQ